MKQSVGAEQHLLLTVCFVGVAVPLLLICQLFVFWTDLVDLQVGPKIRPLFHCSHF